MYVNAPTCTCIDNVLPHLLQGLKLLQIRLKRLRQPSIAHSVLLQSKKKTENVYIYENILDLRTCTCTFIHVYMYCAVHMNGTYHTLYLHLHHSTALLVEFLERRVSDLSQLHCVL